VIKVVGFIIAVILGGLEDWIGFEPVLEEIAAELEVVTDSV
jgi:hypothetical protein